MWEKLLQGWRTREIRNGMVFVLVMMALFRVVANIPLPGINLIALAQFFEANQVLGLLNLFSGGTIRNFSVVALGVAPYITASIVIQLMAMIIPRLEEIQKEGEAGQRRINQWTRLLTVPFSVIQSFSLFALMRRSPVQILTNTSLLHMVSMVFILTAGTMFLVWIGELISEKKVGNGMSLLIAAGILAGLPQSLNQFFQSAEASQWITYLLYAAVSVAMVAGVVFVTEGQRNIPVHHARQSRGGTGMASSLPLRVNMVGVIPIIFAVSLLLFPSLIAQFLIRAKAAWIVSAAEWVTVTLQNQGVYGGIYFLLVIAFTYFYTTVVFHPDRIAENLQKQGGFIPGIRPGRPTSEYLDRIIQRITLGGAVFLGAIAVMPIVAQSLTGASQIALGGTSLLIVVSVVIESVKQIESQLTMHEYDAY